MSFEPKLGMYSLWIVNSHCTQIQVHEKSNPPPPMIQTAKQRKIRRRKEEEDWYTEEHKNVDKDKVHSNSSYISIAAEKEYNIVFPAYRSVSSTSREAAKLK